MTYDIPQAIHKAIETNPVTLRSGPLQRLAFGIRLPDGGT